MSFFINLLSVEFYFFSFSFFVIFCWWRTPHVHGLFHPSGGGGGEWLSWSLDTGHNLEQNEERIVQFLDASRFPLPVWLQQWIFALQKHIGIDEPYKITHFVIVLHWPDSDHTFTSRLQSLSLTKYIVTIGGSYNQCLSLSKASQNTTLTRRHSSPLTLAQPNWVSFVHRTTSAYPMSVAARHWSQTCEEIQDNGAQLCNTITHCVRLSGPDSRTCRLWWWRWECLTN